MNICIKEEKEKINKGIKKAIDSGIDLMSFTGISEENDNYVDIDEVTPIYVALHAEGLSPKYAYACYLYGLDTVLDYIYRGGK